MAKALSKPQAELLEAMKGGVVCHYMRYMGSLNYSPYYFRNDTHRKCTKQAKALLSRGLVKRIDEGHFGDHKLVCPEDYASQ